MLAFTVVVLMLLLVILEVDLHSTGLQSLGLMDDAFSIDPVLRALSPQQLRASLRSFATVARRKLALGCMRLLNDGVCE